MNPVRTRCQHCEMEKTLIAITTLIHVEGIQYPYILPIANYYCRECFNIKKCDLPGIEVEAGIVVRKVTLRFEPHELKLAIELAGDRKTTITLKPLIWQALGLRS